MTVALPDAFENPLEGLVITKASSKNAAAGQHQTSLKLLSLGKITPMSAGDGAVVDQRGGKNHRRGGLALYDELTASLKESIINQVSKQALGEAERKRRLASSFLA